MTPPAAPRQDPRRRRHSAKTVATAQRMYGDGDSWTPGQIAEYLTRNGTPVAKDTVYRWVVPGYRQRLYRKRAARQAADARRRRAEAAAAPGDDDRTLDDALLQLRGRGLSYSALVVVAELYHGALLTEDQARYRLRKLGVPPMPGKSAAVRRQWIEKRKAQEATR